MSPRRCAHTPPQFHGPSPTRKGTLTMQNNRNAPDSALGAWLLLGSMVVTLVVMLVIVVQASPA